MKNIIVLFAALTVSAAMADCEKLYVNYYHSFGATAQDATSDALSTFGLGATSFGAPGIGTVATSAASVTGSGRYDSYREAQIIQEASLAGGPELENLLADEAKQFNIQAYDINKVSKAIVDASNNDILCPNEQRIDYSMFSTLIGDLMVKAGQ